MLSIRPHHLLGTSGVALAALICLNLAIVRAARQLPPQQLLQRIERTAAKTRFVFLGDSQMAADIDPALFSAACARPNDLRPSINVGIGATKASEHFLILEQLLAHAPAADVVFYGFYDNLLTEPVPSRFQELGGNRALAFLWPARAAELIFPSQPVSQWQFRFIATIPMVAERLGIWAKVERARRYLAAIGVPPAAESRFGRAADFAGAEPADEHRFEESLGRAVREQQPLNHSVKEILRLSSSRNLTFHLILMPVPSGHRTRFYRSTAWIEYLNHIRDLIGSGAQVIDASDWLADENFEDALHAAPTGAKLFSAQLAQQVCERHLTTP